MNIDFSKSGLQLRLANAAFSSGDLNFPITAISSGFSEIFPALSIMPNLDTILISFFKDIPGRFNIVFAVAKMKIPYYKSIFLKYIFEDIIAEKSPVFLGRIVQTFNAEEVCSALNACDSFPKEIQENVMTLLYDTAYFINEPLISRIAARAVVDFKNSPLFPKIIDTLNNSITCANSGNDLMSAVDLLYFFRDSPSLEKMLGSIEVNDGSDELLGTYGSLQTLLCNVSLQPYSFDLVKRAHKLCLAFPEPKAMSRIFSALSQTFSQTPYSANVVKNLLDISRFRKGQNGYYLLENAVGLLEKIKDPTLGEIATQNLLKIRRGYYNQKVYCDIAEQVFQDERSVAILKKSANILSKVDAPSAINFGRLVYSYKGHPNLEKRITKLKDVLEKKGENAMYNRVWAYLALHRCIAGAFGY